MLSFLDFGLKFYKTFIMGFTNSLRFYIFIFVITAVYFVLYVFGFSGSLLGAFVLTLLLFFVSLHGFHGLVHVLEDYVFDNFCKILFIFLVQLSLLKVLINVLL